MQACKEQNDRLKEQLESVPAAGGAGGGFDVKELEVSCRHFDCAAFLQLYL